MSFDWMYVENSVQRGPVSSKELKALAQAGKLRQSDLVWKEGLSEWIPAGKVKGLFNQTPSGTRDTDGLYRTVNTPPLPTAKLGVRKEKTAHATAAVNQLEWKDIIALRKDQVVLIEHSDGLGTGVLVSPDGLIVTNKHVVEGARNIQVGFANNTATKAVVLHLDPVKDLAIIRAAIHNAKHFDIFQDSPASICEGEDILAIGHPHGHRFTSTRGIVSVVRQRFGNDYFLQHDVPINPGNSGGPLLDRAGRFVGINTFIRRGAQGLGFAIPFETVQDYAKGVLSAFRSGQLKSPTDDEILESSETISPEEAMHSAVMSFEGKWTKTDNDVYVLDDEKGNFAGVFIAQERFMCCSRVAILNESALKDGSLLQWLLRRNEDLVQATFTIDDDNKLWIRASRFTTGMDATEAYSLITSVFHAAEEYASAIVTHIEIHHGDDDIDFDL